MCVSVHQWAEYILFASLLVLVCIIFAIMAYFYTYTDPAKIEAQFREMDPDERKRRQIVEMARKDSIKSGNNERRGSNSSSSDDEGRQTKI